MLTDFTGKTILITGGSHGIGKACAKRFAALNGDVVITYKSDQDAAECTLAELEPKGNHGLYQLDESQPKNVARFFSRMLSHYPNVDVIVNNAGIYQEYKANNITHEQWQLTWQETIGNNLNGVANMCYFSSRHMMQQGGGKIINVSSRSFIHGETDHMAYAASKAGLNSMSQSLAISLAPYNVSVHIIAPRFAETDINNELSENELDEVIKKDGKFNRVASPDEVARLATLYASPDFEINTSGIPGLEGTLYPLG